jgi:hypothetical protein
MTCQLICLNILREPVKCIECSYHFCRDCVEKWNIQNGSCPNCRRPLKLDKADKILLDDISDLEFYCKNRKKGCQDKLSLIKLSSHESIECLWEDESCRWCYKVFLREVYKEHVLTCERRKIPCRGCSHDIPITDFEDHYLPCLENTIALLRQNQKNEKKTNLHLSNNIYYSNSNITVQKEYIACIGVNVPKTSFSSILKPKLNPKFRWTWVIKNY